MTTLLATATAIDPALIERVLIHGDLRQLSPAQKVNYYKAVCESVGLNPLTKPFEYITLNGKEVLYALRAATEQLRQIHAVSIAIMAREVVEDCYVVTARATLSTGRQDENIGVVPIANLKGESRANAMMKAETKAKRRVTLAICGLGMLDETEVASIESQGYVVEAPAPRPAIPPAGERENPSVPNGGDISGVDSGASRAPAAGSRADEGRPDLGVDMPAGARRILRVKPAAYGAKGFVELNAPVMGTEATYPIYSDQLKAIADELCQTGEPCFVECKQAKSSLKWRIESILRVPKHYDDAHEPDHSAPVDDKDPLPF